MNKEEINKTKRGGLFGYFLIVLGLIFLFEKAFSLNLLAVLPWDYIWPLLLIAFGVHIVTKRK